MLTDESAMWNRMCHDAVQRRPLHKGERHAARNASWVWRPSVAPRALGLGSRGHRPRPGAGQEVFSVGTTQDIDSINPLVGALVIDYEIWNLQYATVTDKAADDFAVIPGLAESWEISDDGLTVTYTFREGLQWSDGEPLTAEDVAYTINRSRDEEWINHVSTTANLEARPSTSAR